MEKSNWYLKRTCGVFDTAEAGTGTVVGETAAREMLQYGWEGYCRKSKTNNVLVLVLVLDRLCGVVFF